MSKIKINKPAPPDPAMIKTAGSRCEARSRIIRKKSAQKHIIQSQAKKIPIVKRRAVRYAAKTKAMIHHIIGVMMRVFCDWKVLLALSTYTAFIDNGCKIFHSLLLLYLGIVMKGSLCDRYDYKILRLFNKELF